MFDYPKDEEVIKRFISLQTSYDSSDSLILDFFSGSATTAHAVMQLNAEDGGNRRYIMVQLPEATDPKSEAHKAGYANICEIGKERIRRAGRKITDDLAAKAAAWQGELTRLRAKLAQLKADNPLMPDTERQAKLESEIENVQAEARSLQKRLETLDTGFRVLKCDTSNMKEVFYRPDEVDQTLLENQDNNVEDGRTNEDLLFQVMLELGILLSARIVPETIAGFTVFNVAGGELMACFDSNITNDVVTAIANRRPNHAVFRDSGMRSDAVLTNFDQIFAAISPNTKRRVL